MIFTCCKSMTLKNNSNKKLPKSSGQREISISISNNKLAKLFISQSHDLSTTNVKRKYVLN